MYGLKLEGLNPESLPLGDVCLNFKVDQVFASRKCHEFLLPFEIATSFIQMMKYIQNLLFVDEILTFAVREFAQLISNVKLPALGEDT